MVMELWIAIKLIFSSHLSIFLSLHLLVRQSVGRLPNAKGSPCACQIPFSELTLIVLQFVCDLKFWTGGHHCQLTKFSSPFTFSVSFPKLSYGYFICRLGKIKLMAA